MTVEELIRKYEISLGTDPKTGKRGLWIRSAAAKKGGVLEEIRQKKEEIMELLDAEKSEAERKAQERKDRIDAIEGLKEIKAALRDLEAWHDEWDESFRDVGGLGVRPKPQYDIQAMKEKYPRAAAYLRAEAESRKSNYELASIGRKALEEVIFGDWEKAMTDMDAEIEAFTVSHAWD